MSKDQQASIEGNIEETIVALTALYPEQVSRNAYTIDQHASGESWHLPQRPDAVVYARSTEEVSQIVKICATHGCPIVAFGAGSCIEGQVQAVAGGISLDTSEMDQVIAVNPEDMDCQVQCGAICQNLNEYLRDIGLFFPIDIGAHATIGGMAATRASGTMTVRYGTMKDLVLSMTVVMADGSIVKTGSRARKSSAGYDLTRLLIGSEGTLGIITELNLRLFGLPETAQVCMCSFDSIDAATNMVVEALQYGLCINRIELADALQMQAINAYSDSHLDEKATLFIDLAGAQVSVEHDLEEIRELAQSHNASTCEVSTDMESYQHLWKIRHSALFAAWALRPGTKGLSTDVCVPLSNLPTCIGDIQVKIAETDVVAPLVGHVGDGNFHLVLLFDPDQAEEVEQVQRLASELSHLAISLDGTCTGEHGVGLGKQAYLDTEMPGAVPVMRAIKLALDPQNLLNPGKIFAL